MKRVIVCCAAVFMMAAAAMLSGCNKVVASASEPDVDAVETLRDIKTTQYFTDDPVAQADVETIVQVGINAPSAMNTQPWHFSVITDDQILGQLSAGMGFGFRPQNDWEGMAAPEGMTPPEGMTMPEGMTPPDGMMPPEGMEGGRPEGMQPPEGFSPDGAMPEGMEFPLGQMSGAPGGGSGAMSKAGVTDAPLVIVISCQPGSELDVGQACQNMSATAQLLGYGTKIMTSATMSLNGSEQNELRQQLGIPEGYTVAAVLLIGHEDTMVDTGADGYTAATTRNPANEMVTYVTGDSK